MTTCRHRFSPRKQVALDFEGSPSMTKQSMRDECDINNIMRRFVKVGMVSHLNPLQGQYGDAPTITFHEAMNIVRAADESFAALPGKVRKRFHNDPGEYMSFCENPENLAEARLLGLVPPEASASSGGSSSSPAPGSDAPPIGGSGGQSPPAPPAGGEHSSST